MGHGLSMDGFHTEVKLLTFLLGEQEYGIHILEAREVVGQMEVDPVPQTPDFMKGVINLRGKIIPVVDLRTKFRMTPSKPSKENCIIVVEIDQQLTGMAVDFLVGVITVNKNQLEASPRLGNNIDTTYISSIAKLDTRVIIVLDMVSILSNDELAAISQQAVVAEC